MRVVAVVGVVLSASCSYSVSFQDCQVGCSTSGCPDGFTCGTEALCRAEGALGTCAALLDAATDTGGDADAGASRLPGIYVTGFNTNTVVVFALDATGSAAPLRTISGSDTQLDAPLGIAIDRAGNIYVANLGGAVTVYPGDADWDVAPSRVIDVPRPVGIAIGSADDVFVASQSKETVFHVPPGATTSDRSFTPIATSGEPYLVLDEAGDVTLAVELSVATYAATATGSATPLRSFTLPLSEDFAPALAVTAGALEVTEETGQVLVFDEQTTGAGSAAASSTLAPPEIVHAEAGMSLAVDTSSGSPVFYVGAAQTSTIVEVPVTGSGANLTAGTVGSITLPSGLEAGGIAVIP